MPSVLGKDNGSGYGVRGEGPQVGVVGESPTGVGVTAKTDSGKALVAQARSGPAVSAFSDTGPGLEIVTNTGSAIDAQSGSGSAVSGESGTGAGVVGKSSGFTGVVASSESGAGVSAFSDTGPGVESLSNSGAGVVTKSIHNVGLDTVSENAAALRAESTQDHAITATTATEQGAGVYSTNTSQGAGIGVVGTALGDNGIGVLGESSGNWDRGTGVVGRSENDTGVLGSGRRCGVEGRSRGGTGVRGQVVENEDGTPAHGDGVVGESFSGDGVRGHSEQGAGVYGESSSGPGVRAETAARDSSALIAIQRETYSTAAALYAEHRGGRDAGYFKGNVKVTGHIEFVGADCAEEFDVVGDMDISDISPGTVVVIGEDNALAPSDRAFDTRVAGVITGTGDLAPALVLGAAEHASGDRIRVALTGRVYCKVDAGYGSIAPGDLLTTSPTPGHAMRVRSGESPVGALLGKAMSPHSDGAGLIPILVALH